MLNILDIHERLLSSGFALFLMSFGEPLHILFFYMVNYAQTVENVCKLVLLLSF